MRILTVKEIDSVPEDFEAEEYAKDITQLDKELHSSKWLKENYQIALIQSLLLEDPTQIVSMCLCIGYISGYTQGISMGHKEALKEMLEGK